MATRHPACDKTWAAKSYQHCPACCETFSGTSTGDAHRTGTFDPPGRRCLTSDEMREAGLRLVNGVWRGAEAPPEVRLMWRLAPRP